jgi:hypothetical protein
MDSALRAEGQRPIVMGDRKSVNDAQERDYRNLSP